LRALLGGTLTLSAAAGFATLIRGLATLATVRYLGAADYGYLAAALALATVACYAVDLGSSFQLTRLIAREPRRAPEHLGNALLITLPLMLLLWGALLLAAALLHYPAPARQLLLPAGLGMLLLAARSPLLAALRALDRIGRSATAEVVAALAIAAMLLFGIQQQRPLPFFGSAYALAGIAGMAISVMLLLPLVRPRPLLRSWTPFLRASLPFAASNIFYVIYGHVDTIMLAGMRSAAEVGTYSAAYRLVGLTALLPNAFSAALLPLAFALGAERRAELRQLFRINLRWLAVVAIPVALFLCLYAPALAALLLGDEGRAAVPILRILSLQILLRFLSYAPADALYATGRETTRVRLQAAAALLNLLLNLIAIPRWGAAGAAAATLLTEAFILLLFARRAAAATGPLGMIRSVAGPAAAATLPTLLLLRFSLAGFGPPLALLLYIGLLPLLRVISVAEVRALFRRRDAAADQRQSCPLQ
jgi:O-antigen/teichoic acid export membrane protein